MSTRTIWRPPAANIGDTLHHRIGFLVDQSELLNMNSGDAMGILQQEGPGTGLTQQRSRHPSAALFAARSSPGCAEVRAKMLHRRKYGAKREVIEAWE